MDGGSFLEYIPSQWNGIQFRPRHPESAERSLGSRQRICGLGWLGVVRRRQKNKRAARSNMPPKNVTNGHKNGMSIAQAPLIHKYYSTISTVSSQILKICRPRWPINFLLNSSDLKRGLFCGCYALLKLRNGTVCPIHLSDIPEASFPPSPCEASAVLFHCQQVYLTPSVILPKGIN
jgi:hypothetical protein